MNHKYKILCVNDDEFLTDLYKKKLENSGFEVETMNYANDDFVGRVSMIKPDLISLDIIMPGRDGLTALKLLKDDERTKNMRAVGRY